MNIFSLYTSIYSLIKFCIASFCFKILYIRTFLFFYVYYHIYINNFEISIDDEKYIYYVNIYTIVVTYIYKDTLR